MRYAYRIRTDNNRSNAGEELCELMTRQADLSTRGGTNDWRLGWFDQGIAIKFASIADWRHFDRVFTNENAAFFKKHGLLDPARDLWFARATASQKRVYFHC